MRRGFERRAEKGTANVRGGAHNSSAALNEWTPEAGIARRTAAAAQGAAAMTASSIAQWLRPLAAAYSGHGPGSRMAPAPELQQVQQGGVPSATPRCMHSVHSAATQLQHTSNTAKAPGKKRC